MPLKRLLITDQSGLQVSCDWTLEFRTPYHVQPDTAKISLENCQPAGTQQTSKLLVGSNSSFDSLLLAVDRPCQGYLSVSYEASSGSSDGGIIPPCSGSNLRMTFLQNNECVQGTLQGVDDGMLFLSTTDGVAFYINATLDATPVKGLNGPGEWFAMVFLGVSAALIGEDAITGIPLQNAAKGVVQPDGRVRFSLVPGSSSLNGCAQAAVDPYAGTIAIWRQGNDGFYLSAFDVFIAPTRERRK